MGFRAGKLDVLSLYWNRYLRLTPLLIVLVLEAISLEQFCGNGPVWPLQIESTTNACKRNWWLNLLYVHNYIYRGHRVCLARMKRGSRTESWKKRKIPNNILCNFLQSALRSHGICVWIYICSLSHQLSFIWFIDLRKLPLLQWWSQFYAALVTRYRCTRGMFIIPIIMVSLGKIWHFKEKEFISSIQSAATWQFPDPRSLSCMDGWIHYWIHFIQIPKRVDSHSKSTIVFQYFR